MRRQNFRVAIFIAGVATAIVVSELAMGSHYLVARPIAIEMQVTPKDAYQVTGVVARASADGGALTLLQLLINGQRITVPRQPLKGIHDPDLGSVQILYGSESDKAVYISIEGRSASEGGSVDCESSISRLYVFEFLGGEFIGWTHEEIDKGC